MLFNKIYVICPAHIQTGGPELLHQLVYVLTNLNQNAYIVYTGITDRTYKIINDYTCYVHDYLLPTEIIDETNNIIIVPETNIYIASNYIKCKKAIWWLSVDNFFLTYYSIQSSLKYKSLNSKWILKDIIHNIKQIILHRQKYLSPTSSFCKKFDFHFCQSHYAYEFCKRNKYKNIYMLTDYINTDFEYQVNSAKENIILYNPQKGLYFTNKIINRAPQFTFVPIQNMSRTEVIDKLAHAKIYIDFGNHPGKDRLPREACLANCIIITGKKGSAAYYEDVPIPIKYKFNQQNSDIAKIIALLEMVLNNYEAYIKDFHTYQDTIRKEKDVFISQVKNIFTEILHQCI